MDIWKMFSFSNYLKQNELENKIKSEWLGSRKNDLPLRDNNFPMNSYSNSNTDQIRLKNKNLNFMELSKEVELNPHSISQELLYEFYIPIDSVLFQIGAYNLSNNNVKDLIKNILAVKNLISESMSRPKSKEDGSAKVKGIQADETINFNILKDILYHSELDQAKKDKRVDRLLNFRNGIITKDESNMFLKFLVEKQRALLKHLEKIDKDESFETVIDKDKEYEEMIMRLRDNLIDGTNLRRSLMIEKNEFYKKRIVVRKEEYKKLILNLSLGGFIIRIPKLYEIVNNLELHNKTIVIRSWVNSIMSSVSDLEAHTKNKNLIDQKQIIKEFLISFVYRSSSTNDEVLQLKSEIYSKSKMQYHELIEENIEQEKEIIEMIRMVDNITTGEIDINYSLRIAEKYLKYLLSGKDEDKESLLSLF